MEFIKFRADASELRCSIKVSYAVALTYTVVLSYAVASNTLQYSSRRSEQGHRKRTRPQPRRGPSASACCFSGRREDLRACTSYSRMLTSSCCVSGLAFVSNCFIIISFSEYYFTICSTNIFDGIESRFVTVSSSLLFLKL